ncbi:MAG: aminoacyl-tRNA hydrolase [Gammaproteobacteria bacterium]
MSPVALIAGLGNPGPEYALTRHNAGFWFADALVSRFDGSFAAAKQFHGEAASIRIAGESVRVLKPMTFMNRSGQAVRALAQFYKIEPAQILVVHDELDLEPGTARLKVGGGHGGHNGLRDITSHLGAEFLRLRIGIGHPRDARGGEPVEWVLKRPSKDDDEAIRGAIGAALDEMERLVTDGPERVMERLNRRS